MNETEFRKAITGLIEMGETVEEIAETIDTPIPMIRRWINGTSCPPPRVRELIAGWISERREAILASIVIHPITPPLTGFYIEHDNRRISQSLVDPKTWHVPVEGIGCSVSQIASLEDTVKYIMTGKKLKF